MEYIHPKVYKGIKDQDKARLMVEENCLKCSEFMGKEHDFSECDLKGTRCPKPFKAPSLLYAKDLVKCEVESEDKGCERAPKRDNK